MMPPCGAAPHPHHGEATGREAAPSILPLGCVDGLEQDEASSKLDEGEEVSCGFLTAKRDTFEALEFTDSLLNACTGFVKRLGEEGGPIPGVGLVWNDRSDAALSRGGRRFDPQ